MIEFESKSTSEQWLPFISLKSLNFSHNKIIKIENLDLLAELLDLDLNDNLIKEISGLESCLELTSLDLSQNKIKRVTALH